MKMYFVGNLADHYKMKSRFKEAQTLLKYIIDSKLVPADLYRFHLAEAYLRDKEFDEAGDLFIDLYCRRVFEAKPEYLSLFEMQTGRCLREAIHRGLDFLGERYFFHSNEYKRRGEALAANGNSFGKCYY